MGIFVRASNADRIKVREIGVQNSLAVAVGDDFDDVTR